MLFWAFTFVDTFASFRVAHASVRRPTLREDLPNQHTVAPYVTKCCVFAEVQSFRCGPLDWNLFHSIGDYWKKVCQKWFIVVLQIILPIYSSSSRDIPKSDIFTMFSAPMRQFLAARSRWMQFFDSRYRMPKNEMKFNELNAWSSVQLSYPLLYLDTCPSFSSDPMTQHFSSSFAKASHPQLAPWRSLWAAFEHKCQWVWQCWDGRIASEFFPLEGTFVSVRRVASCGMFWLQRLSSSISILLYRHRQSFP